MLWRMLGQFIFMSFFLLLSQLIIQLISAQFYFSPITRTTINPTLQLISFLGNGLALTFSIWLAGRILDRRRFVDFGFKFNRGWWLDFLFGLGLGASLMLVIFLIELASGWITIEGYFYKQNPAQSFIGAITIPLIIFIVVGFYEELFSRGYQLTNLAEGFSGKNTRPEVAILSACILSSCFFGLLHATNSNATFLTTVNIGLAGIFLAAGYLLTGQLALSIGLHISWNIFQGNIFGFPVSGGDFRFASLIHIQQSGPALITGGNFGPEGGLLGTFINLVGILLIINWVKHRTHSVNLHISISEPPTAHLSENKEKM